MKTIIAGSRKGFTYEDVVKAMKKISWKPKEIISGGCDGVDTFGEQWAKKRGIDINVIHAFCHSEGKQAGPNRNRRMADEADALVALWDGESKGTKNMIAEARKRGLKVFIYAKQEEFSL